MEIYRDMYIYKGIYKHINTPTIHTHIYMQKKKKNFKGLPPALKFRNLGKNQGSGPLCGIQKRKFGLSTLRLGQKWDVSLECQQSYVSLPPIAVKRVARSPDQLQPNPKVWREVNLKKYNK